MKTIPGSVWRAAKTPSKSLGLISNHEYHDGWVRSLPSGTAAIEGEFGVMELKRLILRDEDGIASVLKYTENFDFTIGEFAFIYSRNEDIIKELDFESVYGDHLVYAVEIAREHNGEKDAALAWAVMLHVAMKVGFDRLRDVVIAARETGISFDEAVPYLMDNINDMVLIRKALDSGIDPSLAHSL